VIVERGFEFPILVALLHGGNEVLAAVLDPFDGPAQLETRRRYCDFFRIHDEFRAKAYRRRARQHESGSRRAAAASSGTPAPRARAGSTTTASADPRWRHKPQARRGLRSNA